MMSRKFQIRKLRIRIQKVADTKEEENKEEVPEKGSIKRSHNKQDTRDYIL